MSVAQYDMVSLSVADLERISLPPFQRKFVWTQSKKNEFIETLHAGLPFGAILVYPTSELTGSTLLILDGQQRLSTIQEYKTNPLSFWKPNNLEQYSDARNKFNSFLKEEHILSERAFDELLILCPYEQAKAINKVVLRDHFEDALALIESLNSEIDSYVDLDSLKIPAIKFLGSKNLIAQVFANLNRGGVPLTKYEIFGAVWTNTQIQLLPAGKSSLQDSILDNVKQYYIDMSSSVEFDLEGFSEDELALKRCITLSELAIALGRFVQDKLNALVPQTPTAISETGFGILGIAVGVDNRKLDSLIDYEKEINTNLQAILERVERICVNLQDIFSKMLKRIKADKNGEYVTDLSTTFKTLSYFAALWQLDPDSLAYKNSLKNIKAYYVFDSLTKAWSSHGDQRLLDFYPTVQKRDYLSPVNPKQFSNAFSQYLDDANPGISFPKECKALTTIHANLSYLSNTVPHGESYELEHIIAKKKINSIDDGKRRNIFGNSIGNCMYLPRLDNNKKKDKTLYQVNDSGRYDEPIEQSLYPSVEEFERVEVALANRDFSDVNKVILIRAHRVSEALVALLTNA